MSEYKEIADKLKEADAILIGASNGFSISEGLHILRTIRLLKRFSEILKGPMGFGISFRGFLPTGHQKK